jgi:hypothetical protein
MVVARAGQVITAGMLNALADDETLSLTLTGSGSNPTLGTGGVAEVIAHYNGDLAVCRFNITFGTASAAAGTGTYQIDLPAALTMVAGDAASVAVGEAEINDGGTAYPMEVRTSTSTRLLLRHLGDATHGNGNWTTTTVPMGNNDFVRGRFVILLA